MKHFLFPTKIKNAIRRDFKGIFGIGDLRNQGWHRTTAADQVLKMVQTAGKRPKSVSNIIRLCKRFMVYRYSFKFNYEMNPVYFLETVSSDYKYKYI